MARIRRQDVAVLRLAGRVLVDRPRRQRRAKRGGEARRAAGGTGRDGDGRFPLLIDLYVDGPAARVRAATA